MRPMKTIWTNLPKVAKLHVLTGRNNNNNSNHDDDDDDSEVSEHEAPGQVGINSGRKVRKRTNAKEARTNLQKQQKSKPARANNQKSKDMRRAKSEIKEYLG
mmetsp:Transcript_53405/g.86395  ORF Transcript_53405/g.86395 Transcript_53405/m.86395 type:complete len:102 (+) Transcript_53405:131-436(+)